MDLSNKKIALFQNQVPDYRVKLLNELNSKVSNLKMDVYATSFPIGSLIFPFYLLNHKIYFRRFHITPGIRKIAQKYDILIVMNDIHWLSFMLLLFNKKNYKIILWGQGITNTNNRFSSIIRKFLAKKADALLFYDNIRKDRFCAHDDRLIKKSFVAVNTLIVNNHERIQDAKRDLILFVGRLNSNKRPTDLINAYAALPESLRSEYKLMFIGEGDQSDILNSIIKKERLQNDVFMAGAIYDDEQLKGIFSRALFTVIPGTVGLGVVHSFAYGVPLVASYNRNHGPEFNYCEDSNTFFYNDSVDELNKVFYKVLSNPKLPEIKGVNSYNYFKSNLQFENWCNGLINSISYV